MAGQLALSASLYAFGLRVAVNHLFTFVAAPFGVLAQMCNPRWWVMAVIRPVATRRARRKSGLAIVLAMVSVGVGAGAPLMASRISSQDDDRDWRQTAERFLASDGSIDARLEAFVTQSPAARDFAALGSDLAFSRVHFENAARETRDHACLSRAIFYEAGHEPVRGQLAVAEVIVNRVNHNLYPNTICDVIYEGSERRTGCQFSFTCDGAEDRAPRGRAWERSQAVARHVMLGLAPSVTNGATHYHADYVSPYWAPQLVHTDTIGTHIFYRFPKRDGRA